MLPDDDKTSADTIQPTHASRLTNSFLLLRKIRTSVIRTFSVKFELVFYEHLLLRANLSNPVKTTNLKHLNYSNCSLVCAD